MAVVTSAGGGRYTISGRRRHQCQRSGVGGDPGVGQHGYAGHHLGFVNAAIYRIARGPLGPRALHDITTGDNTVRFPPQTVTGYSATPGWDPVTGWGSPDASVLVPLLAGDVRSGDANGL